MKRAWLLLLAAASVGLAAAALVQAPFANGPEEWEWTFRPPGLEPWPAAGAALAAAAVIALGLLPARRMALAGSILAGTALTLLLTAAQPAGFARVLGSLASRTSFGYLWDAGLAPASRELLADYDGASAELNQHSRTHPPGTLLAVRALDRLLAPVAARFPALAANRAVAEADEAIAREIGRARDRHRRYPRQMAGAATFVALAFLLPFLGALTAWPLARASPAPGVFPPAAERLAVAFWLLVPARTLFTPSLDQALPFLLVGAAALAAGAAEAKGMEAWWRAAAAGLALFLACFLTWGYLAALPLVLLIAAGRGRFRWQAPVILGAAFAVPWIVLRLATGFDAPAALRSALALHRLIAVDNRSYSLWLAWNPYDFALLTGPAVLGLALFALVARHKESSRWRWPLWGWWALLAALLVSGSVRGEVGRIWLMWMPFAAVFAAGALAGPSEEPEKGWSAALLTGQAILLFALAASMVFVS